MKCSHCGKESNPRSLKQNSYYRGVIIKTIADETGNDEDDVHHEMRRKFLKIGERMLGDRLIEITRSTTSLSTVEMELYHTKIREWASRKPEDGGLGIMIPLPNEELQSA